MTAPLPALDFVDEPILFVATTYAQTLEPVPKSNGLDMRFVTDIVQYFCEIIEARVPSQEGSIWE